MQRAKSFLFISLGVLALAVAYHFGATSATAQGSGYFVSITNYGTTNAGFVAMTSTGEVYITYDQAATWTYRGSVLGGPVPALRESWGAVKQRYR